jgi:Cyclophilin-like
MGKKIRILVSDLKVEAELNDSKTAQLILEALPIEAKTNLWGEEIYFAIPVRVLAYWKCLLYLFRPYPGEPGRRDSSRKRRQYHWQGIRGPQSFPQG